MDYEKAYRDALKRAEAMIQIAANKDEAIDFKNTIFPELKESESESERIRKYLIDFVEQYGDNYYGQTAKASAIAWLEKQGETNETVNRDKFAQGVLRGIAINLITWIDYNAAEGNMCLSNMECKDIEDALVSGNWDKIYAYIKNKLEKQGKQKPANKVEPKFKIGDWIVFNNDNDSIYQIKNVENYEYTLRHILGGSMPLSFSHENMIRAWTIGDAKDGNVLVADDDEPFIFKGLLDPNHPNCPVAHCGLDSEDYLIVSHSNVWWTDECVKPATIEQRNLLFSKMKESGYEWDTDKKELKIVDWSKHVKSEPHSLSITKENPAWSEEDEGELYLTISLLDKLKEEAYTIDCENCINWLKSLKPQPNWKPTKEQMQSLYFAIITYSKKDDCKLTYDGLNSLYDDLKKL